MRTRRVDARYLTPLRPPTQGGGPSRTTCDRPSGRRSYRGVCARRADYDGLQHGADGGVTRCILEGDSAVTAYQRGLLRSAIAGAVPVVGRTGIGKACPLLQHLWWECTAWDHVRQRHPIASTDRTAWPACLSICGVAPVYRHDLPGEAQVLPLARDARVAIVSQLHRYFIAVLSARQGHDGLLDRNARPPPDG